MDEKIKNNYFKESEKNEPGRVVDLKRMLSGKNNKVSAENDLSMETGFIFAKKGILNFGNKKARIDFLKKYQDQDKLQDELFDKNFILPEEPAKEKRTGVIFIFLKLILAPLKIWRFSLFFVKFFCLLFWRLFLLFVFRKKIWQEKIKVEVADDEKKKNPRKILLSGKGKKNIFKVRRRRFLPFIKKSFQKIKDFFIAKSKDDNLYQQALFAEVVRAKFSPLRHILSFVVLSALLLLPFKIFCDYNLADFDGLKNKIFGLSEDAIISLNSATARAVDFEFGEAGYDFFLARDNFRQARENLSEVNGFFLSLAKYAPDEKIRLAGVSKHVLAAGESAANLGRNLSLAFDRLFGDEINLSEKLEEFIEYEAGAINDARRLNAELSKIDAKILPAKYQDKFLLMSDKAKELEDILVGIGEMAKKINVFLGAKNDKRYLFVFQNSDEARASGGFMGSFALIDFSQGKIKNIEIPAGGSYDTEGSLTRKVVSPEPLHLVNPLWHFWDANWWPDWKKSAEKLMWFYNKSGGPTVDGVISFTPTVLEGFLRVLGPVDMSESHGVIMDADNAWHNIREIIEKEKLASELSYEEAEARPKKIIGELLGKILQELPERLNKNSFSDLVVNLESNLNEKHVLFYFVDEDLQAEAEKRNWAGRMKETSKDYLAVINTNIAGGKSDKKMLEKITHEAEIKSDGSIVVDLTIERTHTGSLDEPYYGVRNVNWLRVYAPKGSKLLGASGFRGPDPIYFEYPEDDWEKDLDVLAEEENAVIEKESNNTKVYDEGDKTVFANWSMIDPGQTAVIKLQYLLPFKLEKKKPVKEESGFAEIFNKVFKIEQKDLFVYSLFAQKQPGSRFSSIKTILKVPDDFKTAWQYPNNSSSPLEDWDFESALDADKYWAIVLEKAE